MNSLETFLEREQCLSRIVSDTLAGRRPSNEDALIFLRGGATFWEQDHWFVAWGLHLPSIGHPSDWSDPREWRQLISECDEDGARVKFGSIAVEAVDGRSVVAITQFNAFYGDTLRDFYSSVEEFRVHASEGGWLLSDDRWMKSVLDEIDDETLIAIAFSSGDKNHPRHSQHKTLPSIE